MLLGPRGSFLSFPLPLLNIDRDFDECFSRERTAAKQPSSQTPAPLPVRHSRFLMIACPTWAYLTPSSRPTTRCIRLHSTQDMGSANSTPSKPATTTTVTEKRPAVMTVTQVEHRPDDAAAADLLAQLNLRTSSSSSRPSASITLDSLKAWEADFASNPKHRLASTVLSKSAFADVLVRREAQREAQQVFNVKLSNEGKPITNQKSSGRCWLFSATKSAPFRRCRARTDLADDGPCDHSYLRVMLARKLDLDEFQFSQSYLFFVDSKSKLSFPHPCTL